MDMNQVLAAELNVKPWQVEAAVKLIDEGNTIPFISRYRKEATGSLNDEILRNLYDRLMYLRSLNDRKAVVLASIEEQGKLTAELKKSIEEAATLVVVEDLYRPYRPKRRTRATIAKEKGLEPLANIILLQMTKEPLEKEAEAFVSEEKEVKTAKDAIAGACDIIAESISDEADYRMEIRLQNTRNMLYKTLWELDNDISVQLDSALLKRYGCTECFNVADMALSIFGGIGYTTEVRVGRIWADCRGNLFGGGTPEIMAYIAGRQVAKKYRA